MGEFEAVIDRAVADARDARAAAEVQAAVSAKNKAYEALENEKLEAAENARISKMQQAAAEVLPPSQRLDRRPEGSQV